MEGVWFGHCSSLPVAFLLQPSVEGVKMNLFVCVCVCGSHSRDGLARLVELATMCRAPFFP